MGTQWAELSASLGPGPGPWCVIPKQMPEAEFFLPILKILGESNKRKTGSESCSRKANVGIGVESRFQFKVTHTLLTWKRKIQDQIPFHKSRTISTKYNKV